jgi:hypothetical protein
MRKVKKNMQRTNIGVDVQELASGGNTRVEPVLNSKKKRKPKQEVEDALNGAEEDEIDSNFG